MCDVYTRVEKILDVDDEKNKQRQTHINNLMKIFTKEADKNKDKASVKTD